jgi:hypothetical protein
VLKEGETMRNSRDLPDGPPAAAPRGASVPFEDPKLLGARVRPDRQHDLVALLHDFAGNGATYVVPWPIVPDTFALSGPDRALHGEIWRARAATPAAVQEAARNVAASGAAGAEAQAEEERRRQREQERRTEILGRFVTRLFRDLGLSAEALEATAGRRAQFAAACAVHGIQPEALVATLEDGATLVLPVGLAAAFGPSLAGPRRVLAEELARFARHLSRRAEGATEQAAAYATLAAAAGKAAAETTLLLQRIDGILDALLPAIANWPTARDTLAASVDRLGWVLDGWEDVIAYHVGALDSAEVGPGQRATVMATIAPR